MFWISGSSHYCCLCQLKARFCGHDIVESVTRPGGLNIFSFPYSTPAAISCGDPGVPPNAAVSGSHSWTYGSVIQYSCLHGGVLVGNVTRHCQEDSTWSSAPPYCTGKCILVGKAARLSMAVILAEINSICYQANVSWYLHVIGAIVERARWIVSSGTTIS